MLKFKTIAVVFSAVLASASTDGILPSLPGIRDSISRQMRNSYKVEMQDVTRWPFEHQKEFIVFTNIATPNSFFEKSYDSFFNSTNRQLDVNQSKMDELGEYGSPHRLRSFYNSMQKYNFHNAYEALQDYMNVGWQSFLDASLHQIAPNNSLPMVDFLRDDMYFASNVTFPSLAIETMRQNFNDNFCRTYFDEIDWYLCPMDMNPVDVANTITSSASNALPFVNEAGLKLRAMRHGCLLDEVEFTNCVDDAQSVASYANETLKEHQFLNKTAFHYGLEIPEILLEPLVGQRAVSSAASGALNSYKTFFRDLFYNLGKNLKDSSNIKHIELYKQFETMYYNLTQIDLKYYDDYDAFRKVLPEMFEIHTSVSSVLSTTQESVDEALRIWAEKRALLDNLVTEWKSAEFGSQVNKTEVFKVYDDFANVYFPVAMEVVYAEMNYYETAVCLNGRLRNILDLKVMDEDILKEWRDVPSAIDTPNPPSEKPWDVGVVSGATLGAVALLGALYVFAV